MSNSYEFRVEGHLDHHWVAAPFDGFCLRHHGDGTATLTGAVLDQAHLHGLLARLRDLGVPLRSFGAVAETEEVASSDEPPAGPLAAVAWPRRTDRLVLRPATAEDADPTWRFRRLESVSRWLTEVPHSLEGYRVGFDQPERLGTTLVVLLDGTVVGDLMLRVGDAWAQAEVREQARQTQAELAWVLDPEFVAQGYASEAARELVDICFDHLGLRRVVATCFADNVPSWRLMERIGMRREMHAIGDVLHRSGQWLDTFTYAATSPTWAPRPSGRLRAHHGELTWHDAPAHGRWPAVTSRR